MSHTRQIGYLVSQAIEQNAEKKDQLLAALNLTSSEFDRLCTGRLMLTFEEQDLIADFLKSSNHGLTQQNNAAYQSVVHCMTPFSNPENLDVIMDLIDAYIDVKEVISQQ